MRVLYESQRAMREIRNQALQRGTVAVLDVGTTKIACLILKFQGTKRQNEDPEMRSLAFQSDFRIIGASTIQSRGVEMGEIRSMREAESAIRNALQGAQRMARTRVDHVIICFSGAGQKSHGLGAQIKIEETVVSEQEIGRVLATCDMPDDSDGYDVLHAQPVNFTLDHRSGLTDPRGLVGHMLSVDMHMLTVDGTLVQTLLNCIKRCDLEVAGLASSAYMSGIAALVEDEQELGAACIDMGGGTTSLSVFMKKHMIFADCVPIGGNSITNDISLGLNIGLAQAERIKAIHGGVHMTGIDDREIIDIGTEPGDWNNYRRSATRSELFGIMRPRVEEIFEEVKVRLDGAGFDHLPSQQIILTGAGSQVPGLDLVVSRILGYQVRLGRPMRIAGLPQSANGPGFSAVIGLSLFAACPQDEWWDFGMPSDRNSPLSVTRMVKWLRDNW